MADEKDGHDPAIGRYYLIQLLRLACAGGVLIGLQAVMDVDPAGAYSKLSNG